MSNKSTWWLGLDSRPASCVKHHHRAQPPRVNSNCRCKLILILTCALRCNTFRCTAGQYKPIHAVRFIIGGTIEERILKLQDKKQAVFEGTVGKDAGALVSPFAFDSAGRGAHRSDIYVRHLAATIFACCMLLVSVRQPPCMIGRSISQHLTKTCACTSGKALGGRHEISICLRGGRRRSWVYLRQCSLLRHATRRPRSWTGSRQNEQQAASPAHNDNMRNVVSTLQPSQPVAAHASRTKNL